MLKPPANPVIEVYKRDIDRTLIRASLRLTGYDDLLPHTILLSPFGIECRCLNLERKTRLVAEMETTGKLPLPERRPVEQGDVPVAAPR